MDEFDRENFEETVRDIAREVGRSVERAMERFDIDDMADTIGVDADRAREWADTAGSWLRSQFEHLGDEVAGQAAREHSAPHSAPREPAGPDVGPADPWRSAEPHPLDPPTDEQGQALAALESGRWEVEPGTGRLAAHGEGSGPSDALGLVRELRARDWINADGELTLAGRHALSRWLEARASR
jgi:hypothetical protein